MWNQTEIFCPLVYCPQGPTRGRMKPAAWGPIPHLARGHQRPNCLADTAAPDLTQGAHRQEAGSAAELGLNQANTHGVRYAVRCQDEKGLQMGQAFGTAMKSLCGILWFHIVESGLRPGSFVSDPVFCSHAALEMTGDGSKYLHPCHPWGRPRWNFWHW